MNKRKEKKERLGPEREVVVIVVAGIDVGRVQVPPRDAFAELTHTNTEAP